MKTKKVSKTISLGLISLFFIMFLVAFVFSSSGISANAYTPPSWSGNNFSGRTHTQGTIGSINSVGNFSVSSGFTTGTSDTGGWDSDNDWSRSATGTRYITYLYTYKLSDNLYNALLAGKLNLSVSGGMNAGTNNIAASASARGRIFVQLGYATSDANAKSYDGFTTIATAQTDEFGASNGRNNKGNFNSTTAVLSSASTSNTNYKYVRVGLVGYATGSKSWGSTSTVHFSVNTITLNVAANGDTTAPSVSGTNNAFTASNTVTIADTGSGIWKYELNGATTTLASYNRTSALKSYNITLANPGQYTIKVYDNLGLTAQKTIKYYNPNVNINTYTGSLASNTGGGSVSINGGGYGATGAASGQTVGGKHTMTAAAANPGYYFAYWLKNSGANTGAKYYTHTLEYTIADGDAYTTPLYFDAYYLEIGGSFSAVSFTYSGVSQGPQANAISGYTVEHSYAGINGTSYSGASKPVNAGSYTYTATVKYGTTVMGTRSVDFTINKANVTLNFVEAAAISYGQSIGNSVITATATNSTTAGRKVDGSFSWADIGIKPSVADSNKTDYVIVFNLTDTANYNAPAAINGRLTVNKTAASVTVTGATGITFGQNLGASVVSGTAKNPYDGSAVQGSFRFTDSGIKPTVAQSGQTAFKVTFIPDDTANYANSDGVETLTVEKAMPNVSGLYASQITYGQKLNESTVRGTAVNPFDSANVTGTYVFIDSTAMPAVSDSGKTLYSVRFTPTDTANYLVYEAQDIITLSVIKATPGISGLYANAITYEQSLADAILGATVSNNFNQSLSVPGRWVWYTADAGYTVDGLTLITDKSIIAMPKVAESGYYDAIFIPNDLMNYNVTGGSAQLIVNKKAQAFTYESPVNTQDFVYAETLAKDLADYEIAYNNKIVTLVFYTSAFYPTPRAVSVSITSGGNIATILSVETVAESMARRTSGLYSRTASMLKSATGMVSKTTVKLSINNSGNYGIVSIEARSEGDANYIDAEAVSYDLFVKRPHEVTDGFSDLILTYGDGTVTFNPTLSSNFTDYVITSANGNIFQVSGTGITRSGSIKNAGETYLTINHPGYIDRTNYANSYVALNKTIKVTVKPALVTVSLNSLETIYGENPQFTYTYRGLAYSENYNAVLNLSGLTNDFDPANMKNVGRYTVTPRGVACAGLYENYIFTYVAGELKVNKRDIYVTLSSGEFVYGTSLPELSIGYPNLAYGESVADILEFIAPTVNFGEINSFSNVGRYNAVLNAGSSLNYNFITATVNSVVTVLPANVNVEYEKISVDYDGIEKFSQAVITGVPGGSEPANLAQGISYAYSKNGESYVTGLPKESGFYKVRVTYTPAANDNYKVTVVEFENGIVIGKINPLLILTEESAIYTSEALYPTASATSGFAGGSVPKGRLSYRFKIESGEWVDFAINAAVYSVEVIYTPGDIDDYLAFSSIFENIFEIERAEAVISLESAEYLYDTNAQNYNVAQFAGGINDVLVGTLTYNVLMGEVFGTELPVNAGIYPVKVMFTPSDEFSHNYKYTEKIFERGIVINKAPLSALTLETFTAKYTGAAIQPNDAVAIGLSGGSEPVGSLEYIFKYSGSASFNLQSAINASTYDVRVYYITTDGDNYATGSYDFTSALIVERAAPIIKLNNSESNFTGLQKEIYATVSGFTGATTPRGNLSYRFSTSDSFVAVKPSDAGIYNVEVTYTESLDDNYATTVIVFSGALKINKARPDLQLLSVSESFTGDGIGVTAARAIGVSADNYGPKGTLSFLYYINGVYTDALPVDCGRYNVLVVYTAQVDGEPERNYTDTSKVFVNGVVILEVSPVIILDEKTEVYNGYMIAANEPVISNFMGKAYGTLNIEYRKPGSAWQYIMPQNAGIYDVRVIYRPAANDNYSGASFVFAEALKILPKDITVTPADNQFKIYDGNPIDAATIAYDCPAIIEGNTWSGELAVSGNTDAGIYEIKPGTLTAGDNYNINFVSGVFFSILKREIRLLYPDINSVYDGTAKKVEIGVDSESLVPGESVTVYTTIVGDNISAGVFKAVANINSLNYELPVIKSKEYIIYPAVMTGNKFESVTVPYDGNPHTLTLSSVVDGAAVIFDGSTTFVERGSYTVNATIYKQNYYEVKLSATLNIVKGVIIPDITTPVEKLYYGDALTNLISTTANGTLSLDDGQELTVGTKEYTWTFVPYDIDNYDIATGTVSLTVYKRLPEIDIVGSLTQLIDKPETITPVINGSQNHNENVTVTYVNSQGKIYLNKPDAAGRYTIIVNYSGDENFDAAEFRSTLIIKDKASFTFLWYIGGAVVILIIASSVYFVKRRMRERE